MSNGPRLTRRGWPSPGRLSIVIPAFNEERYIARLLRKVLAVDLNQFGLSKEIIVVDDGSTDRTGSIAREMPGVAVYRLTRNAGKGTAVRAGLARTSGDLVVIQDADLEYEPEDYRPMIAELLRSDAGAVYGSRYLPRSGAMWRAPRYPGQGWGPYWGGRSLSVVQWCFSGTYLSDTVTALKLFRGPVIRAIGLHATGFELDHEITARVLAAGYEIREVPIRYHPRSRAEGKKIRARDWLTAVATYLRVGRRPTGRRLTARNATSRSG
jgi:glycosyltransferase involved in cell wall biosynthesis